MPKLFFVPALRSVLIINILTKYRVSYIKQFPFPAVILLPARQANVTSTRKH